MSLSNALLGAAVGIGARVAQGFSKRALLRERERRSKQADFQTQEQPITDESIQQEYNTRLAREYERRASQTPQTQPETPQQLGGLESETPQIDDEALMQEYERRTRPEPTVVPPKLMQQLQGLWVNARGDVDVFMQWLRNNPDTQLNKLVNQPQMLQSIIQQLEQIPIPEEKGELPPSPIGSSNVKGFSYNKAKGELMVQFHGGGLYKFGGIPENVFKNFANGRAAAKTKGSNAHGSWWEGKYPSVGASHWQYIRDKYPYQKVA